MRRAPTSSQAFVTNALDGFADRASRTSDPSSKALRRYREDSRRDWTWVRVPRFRGSWRWLGGREGGEGTGLRRGALSRRSGVRDAGSPDMATPRSPQSRPALARRCLRVATLQGQYAAWLEALPENLEDSATAEALQAICDLDLTDLQAIVPPRGFGRD